MNDVEYIARGVICNNSEILLCKNIVEGHYYLPGGHIEEGETSAEALAREMSEESNRTITATIYLKAIENEYDREGKRVREKFDVFLARLSDTNGVQSIEKHIDFEWLPVDELSSVNFLPWQIIPEIISAIESNRSFWQ
ncbi:MAG: NUDIX domain-containing protein [Candidatus Paceibacterota bacterium]